MRKKMRANGFSAHVIAGAHSVLFFLHATREAHENLIGFDFARECFNGERLNGERQWLPGLRFLHEAAKHAALQRPPQIFMWADHDATPDTEYVYSIKSIRRHRPQNDKARDDEDVISLSIRTEPIERDGRAVFFNRGVLCLRASLEETIDALPLNLCDMENPTIRRLSRGLVESALSFIARARNETCQLKCAFQILNYKPISDALKMAAASGVDVKVIYSAGKNSPSTENFMASHTPPESTFIPRTKNRQFAHNNFMVLLEKNHPTQIWTSTSTITPYSMLGQCGTAHVISDAKIAEAFNAYWRMLSQDPPIAELKSWCSNAAPYEELQRLFEKKSSNRITPVFYPRRRSRLLDYIGQLIETAAHSVFICSPDNHTRRLSNYFETASPAFHQISYEGPSFQLESDGQRGLSDSRPQKHPTPDYSATEKESLAPDDPFEAWMTELHKLGGHSEPLRHLNMTMVLIDALSDAPQIFISPKNFSAASMLQNDENALFIETDARMADIYVSEFFRLSQHLQQVHPEKETPEFDRVSLTALMGLNEADH